MPVYFKYHILINFEHIDGYNIKKYTKNAGFIHGSSNINIPYSVNKGRYVIMLLGYVVNVLGKELLYLYFANIQR